mgnify:CR=1 FL=1
MSELGKRIGSSVGNVVGSTISNVGAEVGSFVNLLRDFNVIGFALALMMANSVAELANSFIDSVIMPTIQPVLDRVTSEEATSLQIGSFYIDLSTFVKALIKFLALAVVIFVIIQFGVTITKPVSWVSVRSVAPGVKM